jgi:hypothetical protein
MKPPFKAVCLDDSNRPDGIPTSKWLVKNGVYTVIKVDHMNMQGRILGFQLEEIDLSDCFPYTYFAASRFGVPVDQEAFIAALEKVGTPEEELVPA